MKTLTKLSLLLLAVLLAACSKEGNEEDPVGPYELSVYPPEAGFHAADFGYPDADESIFSDTLFIKGGTPPYRIEPVKEIMGIGKEDDAKVMDVFDFTVRSVSIPREADQLIVRFVYHKVNPDFDLRSTVFFPVEFILYDKNGGYAKFEIQNFDLIGGL